jgi:hypothetical protein
LTNADRSGSYGTPEQHHVPVPSVTLSDIDQIKQALLDNRFIYRLRRDAVVDETELAALLRDLHTLSDLWRHERTVDKELAGWMIFAALAVAGAEQRARPNGGPLAERLGAILGDLYSALETPFEKGT